MQSQLIPANCWQWGRMSHAQAIAKKKIKKKKSPKVRMVLLAGSQEAFPTPLQGRGTWTGLLDALASPWTANTLSLSSTIPARAWTSLFLWFFVILAWIFCLQFSIYSFPPLPQNDAYGQDLSLPPPLNFPSLFPSTEVLVILSPHSAQNSATFLACST